MMNKSFAISMLTLALCATQAVADEHKFYGRIDYSVTNSDSGSATHKNKSGTVLENNFTRIGIKGASQLTDSTSLFYQIEVGVNGESQDSGDKPFSARPTFIGVKHSSYGALAVGRIDPVFKMAKGMSDAVIPHLNFAIFSA